MKSPFVIAIDGPVAAGKGTIAPLLAKNLNGLHLYTGSMYRGFALYCIENGIDFKDPEKIRQELENVKVDIVDSSVFLNGKDITERIKEQDVANAVPFVGLNPEVREKMVKKQQEIASKYLEKGKIVVAEGRDVGTKVFPDAKFKIFLTARPKIRAKRRLEQLRQMGEKGIDFDQILKETEKRDKIDSSRAQDPLVSDPEKFGYFVLDNSDISEEETVKLILGKLREEGLIDDNN